jgi:hypothetical protein
MPGAVIFDRTRHDRRAYDSPLRMFSRRAITMAMHEALIKAMHLPDDNDTVRHLHEGGLAIASVDDWVNAFKRKRAEIVDRRCAR